MVPSQKSSGSLRKSKQVGDGIHLRLQLTEGIVAGDASAACAGSIFRDPRVAENANANHALGTAAKR